MPTYETIPVRGTIRLGQFLKLTGLVEDGATATIAIQSGDVLVNGQVEERRGAQLAPGDVVEIDLPTGREGAVVGTTD
ncbi:MAG: RNA-binding S4 domain-containing protein [Buchananella hordeovulneris]|nr:RNA-binding S4 domain-containing protein [Buchananella hordeovulneris]